MTYTVTHLHDAAQQRVGEKEVDGALAAVGLNARVGQKGDHAAQVAPREPRVLPERGLSRERCGHAERRDWDGQRGV